jgi:hypothetical protein
VAGQLDAVFQVPDAEERTAARDRAAAVREHVQREDRELVPQPLKRPAGYRVKTKPSEVNI